MSLQPRKSVLVSPVPFTYDTILKGFKPIDFSWYKNELVIVYMDFSTNEQRYVDSKNQHITTLKHDELPQFDYMHFETIGENSFCVCVWHTNVNEALQYRVHVNYFDTEWHQFEIIGTCNSQDAEITNLFISANMWENHLVICATFAENDEEYCNVLLVDPWKKQLTREIRLIGPNDFSDTFSAHVDGRLVVRAKLIYVVDLPYRIVELAPKTLTMVPYVSAPNVICGCFVDVNATVICIGDTCLAFNLKTKKVFHLDLVTPKAVPEFADGQKCWWINMHSQHAADLIVKNRAKKKKQMHRAFFSSLYIADMLDLVKKQLFVDVHVTCLK